MSLSFTQVILEAIDKNKPKSVEQLAKILNEKLNLPEKEIIEYIMKLEAKGLLILEDQIPRSRSLINYLKTNEAFWYWVFIAVELVTVILVFLVSENFYPFIYLRNALGIIFVLFLPGYALMKTLFPINMPEKMFKGDFQSIERFILSIGMSIAIVSIFGLILYYSSWGLELGSIVTSLFIFNLILCTAAVIREYQLTKPN